MRSVSVENGSGGSSPGCISTAAQSMVRAVEPRRRPGLEPAEHKSQPLEREREPDCGRLADPSGRGLVFADMDQTAQKGAGGEHDGPCPELASIREPDAGCVPATDHQIVGLGFDHFEIVNGARSPACMAAA